MPANAIHDRYISLLIDRSREQEHPSPQMLNRIERTITDREDVEAYIDLLLSKAEEWRHPSLQLLDRVSRYVHLLAVAEFLQRADNQQ